MSKGGSLSVRIGLVQLMTHESRLGRNTLEAARSFLCAVMSKVGHMSEVEIGTANRTMRVAFDDLSRGAKELESRLYDLVLGLFCK